MPLKNYGVLKGKAIDSREGMGASPHFQILLVDDDLRHRIAINVQSKEEPSEILYYLDENFDHPMVTELESLPTGFHELPSAPGGMALDYIRGNCFDTSRAKPLPHNVPGPDNDLNELIHKYVARAIAMESSAVYAFGEKWGPDTERDRYFGFKPGNGIHDIHANQGNSDAWKRDDGVYQDGGLIIHLPDEARWVAIFLAFQSQCFHTDDVTGHRIHEACSGSGGAPPDSLEPHKPPVDETTETHDNDVRIIAALINPEGRDYGHESVTLLNTTPDSLDLDGWAIVDKNKKKAHLSGIIGAGETIRIPLSGKDVQLANKGGIITLLDRKGLKVDGVSYTKESSESGWTAVF